MKRKEWASRPGRSSNWIARSKRFAIYHRDGFRCVYCKPAERLYDGVGLTLDHLISRNDGGDHDPSNLVTACKKCNSARQDKRHPRRTLARLHKLTARPLNMEVGRLLAKLYEAARDQQLVHPLTGRVPPPPGGREAGTVGSSSSEPGRLLDAQGTPQGRLLTSGPGADPLEAVQSGFKSLLHDLSVPDVVQDGLQAVEVPAGPLGLLVEDEGVTDSGD